MAWPWTWAYLAAAGSGARFSFRFDGPLDMRMEHKAQPPPTSSMARAKAWPISFSNGRGAQSAPHHQRDRHGTDDAADPAQLASLVRGRMAKIDPTCVNGELEQLDGGLAAAERFGPRWRLAVVSFHSLEDRRVKNFARRPSATPSRHPRKRPAQGPPKLS